MTELVKCKPSDVEQLRDISIETFVDTFKDQNTEENLNEYLERAYTIEQLTSEINQVGTDTTLSIYTHVSEKTKQKGQNALDNLY